MPYKCCVPQCTYKQDAMLHVFPQENELFTTWCENIGRPELLTKGFSLVRKYYRVCARHFQEDAKFVAYHNRTNLKVGSIPVLHIPHQLPGATDNSSTDASWSLQIKTSSQTDTHKVYAVANTSAASISTLHLPEGMSVETSASEADDGMAKPSSSTGITDNTGKKRKRQAHNEKHSDGEAKRKCSKLKSKLLQKRRNLLLEVNLRNKAQLTPKAKRLYEVAVEYRSLAQKLDDKAANNREVVKTVLKQAEKGLLFQDTVNATTLRFLQSQITQQKKKPKGRRFSHEDKILSLALMKQSPRGYRLLQKIFALPSRKTLMSMLSKVPFDCGINSSIFDSLKEIVRTMKPRDTHCILMFDEMALQPSLFYNKTRQHIDGFQKISSEDASQSIADHAMVFMLKGLAKKWKQPIAYFFTKNGMSNAEIATNIKAIVKEVANTGLKVVATVCDQYNTAAINLLVGETKRNAARGGWQHETYTFKVEEEEIFPLFDFPHLLKGIRNNMLKYDVKFTWKNGEEIASWQHIEALYDLDGGDDDFRMLPKLTDEHVKRDRIKKMKVKHAAHIFSHRVQSTMRGLVMHGNNVLAPSALGTANFLLFVDKLFDSVNASCIEPKDHKLLRRAVTRNTEHITFWNEAIAVLKTVKFFSKAKEFVPPTISNWILSLKNLKLLWNRLQSNTFDFLLTRNLNQDPLENFFSCIRSHGARNINPSATAFRAAFKSLIINNFMAAHSVRANCEEDASEGALHNLKQFVMPSRHAEVFAPVPFNYAQNHVLPLQPVKGELVLQLHGYIAGYMAKVILKALNYCTVCRSELKADSYADEHSLIQCREYRPNALLKPRTKFIVLFGLCNQILHHFLPSICHEHNLKTKLLHLLNGNIKTQIFTVCQEHDLFKLFLSNFVDLYCFTWVSNINKILKGSLTRNINDTIKQQALNMSMKYRSKRYKMRLQKQLQ